MIVLFSLTMILCLFYSCKVVGEEKYLVLFRTIVAIPVLMFVVLISKIFEIIQRFGIFK